MLLESGVGEGIFFAGYFLFEVPGALVAERYSPRLWLARIMISWGVVSGLMALMQTYFRRRGVQVQFNMVDTAVLREAQRHPEKHRDLFRTILVQLSRRIELFLSLPFDKLDRMKLQQAVREIGRTA